MKNLRFQNEVFLFVVVIIAFSKAIIVPLLYGASFWIFDLFVFIVIPCIYFYYRKKGFIYPFSAQRGQLAKKTFFESLFYICVSYMIVLIFSAIGDVAILVNEKRQLVPTFKPFFYYASHLPNSVSLKIIVVIYFAFTAGVIEELIYRGVLGEILTNRGLDNVWVFIFVSALLFAVVHFGGGSSTIIQNFFIGVGLTIVYVWTKDIKFPIIVHTIYDLQLFAKYALSK